MLDHTWSNLVLTHVKPTFPSSLAVVFGDCLRDNHDSPKKNTYNYSIYNYNMNIK